MELDRLLRPRSVAVVGATERAGAYGSEALLNLARLGYAGRVHAVNPGRAAVHGVRSWPSLAALPEVPDAVVVAIPAAAVPAAIEEAGALGCGGAVVFAAGFAEARDGGAIETELVAAARRHGLPVCGPNGNGVVSLHERVALWGDMVAPREAGPVALVSQSGNLAVNALASRRGLRLHTVVSCGNGAVLGAAAYVEALAERDGVRSIALYLEADGDGAAWCAALERCAARGVGVAVLKAGGSRAGAAAAAAHTGAVAGEARAFRAFMVECGAVWAEDPHDLLELAKALGASGARRGRAGGLAVMTCSGGDSSQAADLAEALGAPLPALAPRTVRALEQLLPAAATAQNPLDYTSLLWEESAALRRLVTTLGADPGVGRVLVLYDEPHGLDGAAAASWHAVLGAVRTAAGESAAPVAVGSTLPELLPDATAAELLAAGLPALAGLRSALRCSVALATPPGDPGRIAELGALAAARVAGPAPGAAPLWRAEHEVKGLLRGAGVAVADGRTATTPAEAAAAFAALGGEPVALKLSGPALQHKSELGAVVLGLADAGAVEAAAGRLLALELDAVLLVERMAPPGVELLVAVRTDAVIPVLVVGLGGVWTEALDEVAVLPLPVGAERVAAALAGLRGAGALRGARGGPRADLAAAARLAVGAAELALREGLALLELNPVLVHPDGAVAVDAVASAPPPVPLAQGAPP